MSAAGLRRQQPRLDPQGVQYPDRVPDDVERSGSDVLDNRVEIRQAAHK
ncbi:MAG: hypothetical protein M1358_11955 [Chloroflexi bacterium]|nr:hypothetical protein [Chloroflexota bacterium]